MEIIDQLLLEEDGIQTHETLLVQNKEKSLEAKLKERNSGKVRMFIRKHMIKAKIASLQGG